MNSTTRLFTDQESQRMTPGHVYQALISPGEQIDSRYKLSIDKCSLSPSKETVETSEIDFLIEEGQVTTGFAGLVELTDEFTKYADDDVAYVAFNFVGLYPTELNSSKYSSTLSTFT